MVATRSQTKAAAPQAPEISPALDEATSSVQPPAAKPVAKIQASSQAAPVKKPTPSKLSDQVAPAGNDGAQRESIWESVRKSLEARARPSVHAPKKAGTQQPATNATTNASKGKGKRLASCPYAPPYTNGQSTTIMDLPPELRNDIWTEVLVQGTPIEISPVKPYLREPALLAVSRQVRSETMSIWYAENDFTINGSSPAVRYLRSRSDQQLRSIRSLCITAEGSTQMIKAPRAWTVYLVKKADTLMREFGGRGLRRKALRFQVVSDEQLCWIDGENLERAVITGEPDKDRIARGGPRKG